MRAKVIKTDESVIYAGQIYKFGDEFEIDDLIGKSLIERGYIQGVTDNGDLFAEDEVVDLTVNVEEMSYPQLKAYASELGISASGKKEELIERIKDFLSTVEELPEEAEAETEDEEEAGELPNTSMPE